MHIRQLIRMVFGNLYARYRQLIRTVSGNLGLEFSTGSGAFFSGKNHPDCISQHTSVMSKYNYAIMVCQYNGIDTQITFNRAGP